MLHHRELSIARPGWNGSDQRCQQAAPRPDKSGHGRGSVADLRAALEIFQQAIELPPTDLKSRAVIARAYTRLGYARWMLSMAKATEQRIGAPAAGRRAGRFPAVHRLAREAAGRIARTTRNSPLPGRSARIRRYGLLPRVCASPRGSRAALPPLDRDQARAASGRSGGAADSRARRTWPVSSMTFLPGDHGASSWHGMLDAKGQAAEAEGLRRATRRRCRRGRRAVVEAGVLCPGGKCWQTQLMSRRNSPV